MVAALLLAAALALACLLAWVACRLLRYAWACGVLSRLPGPPISSILGGHLAEGMRQDRHHLMTDWANEMGGIYRVRILWRNFVIVTDPYMSAEVLRSKTLDKDYHVYDHFNAMTRERFPHVVSSPTNAHWKMIRKGISPAYNPANLRNGFHHVERLVQMMMTRLQEAGPTAVVDMDLAAQRLTLDVIGWVGFDRNMGAMQGFLSASDTMANMLTVTRKGGEEIEKRMREPGRELRFWDKDVIEGREYTEAFAAEMQALLREIKAKQAAGTLSPSTVAGHLLAIRNPATGKPVPDERLVAEIGAIYFGGFETTAHTIAWTLFLISQNPAVEAKVVEELERAGLLVTPQRPAPRPLTYPDLGQLKYLNCCIKESMRMMSVTGQSTLRIGGEITLGSYKIPANTSIWVMQHGVMNSKHNFEDPSAYKPERWAVPGAEYPLQTGAGQSILALPSLPAKASETKATGGGSGGDGEAHSTVKRFIPFQDGPRNCAGQGLANMTLTTMLALVYARFTFKLADEMGGAEGVRAAERYLITLQPSTGMLMQAVPRPSM